MRLETTLSGRLGTIAAELRSRHHARPHVGPDDASPHSIAAPSTDADDSAANPGELDPHDCDGSADL